MKRITRGISDRSGFSLLEVILALGLSSLLLAAVYSALQMHWTYSTHGQAEMERSQIARSLFTRIETDLRSVVFQPASGSTSSDSTSSSTSDSTSSSTSLSSAAGSSGTSDGTSSGTSGTGSSTDGTSSTSGTSSSETTETQKNGIFGDAQSLVAHSSLPSKASSGLAAANTDSNTAQMAGSSDLQSVIYFLAGSNSQLAQQMSSGLGNGVDGRPVTGLARMQGDRLTMTQADQNGGLASLAGQVQLLAAEVASIEFEYFDGVSWTTTWDTATSNSIPNAIRVTIQFQPPDKSRGGWFAKPVNPSTNRYQQVIAMPLAEPYIDSSAP